MYVLFIVDMGNFFFTNNVSRRLQPAESFPSTAVEKRGNVTVTFRRAWAIKMAFERESILGKV